MRRTPGLRRALKWLQIACFICGALALGYSAFLLMSARIYQHNASQRFNQPVITAQPPPATANPQPVADGMPVARFEIPRLNIDSVMIEGVSDSDLHRAIGHIPGTALPGSQGNVGIAGHRDTFFRPLRNIHEGDVISLTTLEATYRYQVESTEVVTPDRSDVLNPTSEPHLTLVTCFPFYYVGSAPKRFIVHAREIDSGRPASPAFSGKTSPAEGPRNSGN
jgi:sortase A